MNLKETIAYLIELIACAAAFRLAIKKGFITPEQQTTLLTEAAAAVPIKWVRFHNQA